MKISRRLLIHPAENEIYGVAAIVLTTFVMAYSTLFGQISILAFYAVWLPLIIIDYRAVLGPVQRMALPLALVGLYILSVIWSNSPGTSLRASVQFATCVLCAVIASRTITVKILSIGAMLGCLIVVLFSLAVGRSAYDMLDGSYTLVGAFASKNQLGTFASLGILFSIAILFAPQREMLRSAIAVVTILIGAYALIGSQSATSILSLAGTLGVFAVLRIAISLRTGVRIALVALAIPLGIMLVLAILQSSLADQVLGAFGKDSTLTGRTYLWGEGLTAFHEAPLLGVGYRAYWVAGFSEAERLWEEFYIKSQDGFHFHNTYIEMMVELGMVGLVTLVMLLASILKKAFSLLIYGRQDYDVVALFSVVFILLIRSFFEIDITYPYTFGGFLVFYAFGHLQIQDAVAKNVRKVSGLRPQAVSMPRALGHVVPSIILPKV